MMVVLLACCWWCWQRHTWIVGGGDVLEVGGAVGGGGLSVAEQRFVDAAVAGGVCDLSSEPADDRRVRAGVLYDLWVGDRWPLHPKAAHLKHAVIEGDLDLAYGTLRAPLHLSDCQFGIGALCWDCLLEPWGRRSLVGGLRRPPVRCRRIAVDLGESLVPVLGDRGD